VLELARIEHVIGAESQAETGEPHALPEADPLDQQAITACFAMDYLPGEDHTIDRPADYDFWRSYRAEFWPGPQLGWTFVDPVTLEIRRQAVFENPGGEDLWTFRRIFYRGHYPAGEYASDITLINWPQNDYCRAARRGLARGARGPRARGQAAEPVAALLDADRGATPQRRLRIPGLAAAQRHRGVAQEPFHQLGRGRARPPDELRAVLAKPCRLDQLLGGAELICASAEFGSLWRARSPIVTIPMG
jgi:hypothetical protein